MRRVTVFTDESSAAKLTAYCEEQGLDYMSEDYAEPTIVRRNPPERRPQPERAEPAPGMLRPTKKPMSAPVKGKPGRKPGRASGLLLMYLKEAPNQTLGELQDLSKQHGRTAKEVRDTLRRLVSSGKVKKALSGDAERYALQE